MVIVEDMADHLPKEDPSKGEYMQKFQYVWILDIWL